MEIINKTQQKKILKDLKTVEAGTSVENAWTFLCIGVVVALGPTCPPHWHMNVLCGRADRLKEEVE